MIDDRDWARIARYLAAECTTEEADATRRWIAGDPERRELVDVLEHAWARSAAQPRAFDATTAWQRVSARARRFESVSLALDTPNRRRGRSRSWWVVRVAATAALAAAGLVAVGITVIRRASRPRQPVTVSGVPRDREYRTSAGQRAVVNLVDGTRVELGVESTLRVRAWNGPVRDVFLEGEAAFTVVHDSTRPFLVHARDAVAEDLGTRFTVHAYPTDQRVRVVVMSGRVAFGSRQAGGPRTVLRAGDEAALDSAGHVTVARRADTAAVLGWTRERFVVNAMPLRDVARQLERWFDVHIVIPDSSAAAMRVTINMPASRLTDVLGAATTPLGLLYTQQGNVVVIRRARPGRSDDDDSTLPRRSDP